MTPAIGILLALAAGALNGSCILQVKRAIKRAFKNTWLVYSVVRPALAMGKIQMGVGGIDSWGSLPLEKYRLPYGDYQYRFKITAF